MTISSISGSHYNQYQSMLSTGRLSDARSLNNQTGNNQSVSNQAVNPVKPTSAVTSSSSAYADIQDFLNSYQSKLTDLESTASKLKDGGADQDTVISSVKDLVKGYNDVTELLQENSGRGSGAASHLASFNRGMADEKTLKALGITRNGDGNLEVDEEALKNALETDPEGTGALIWGQFGIAEKAASRADAALSTPVQRVVNHSLASVAESRKQEDTMNIQYLSNFSRSGPYHMTNAYSVGLLLNTLA